MPRGILGEKFDKVLKVPLLALFLKSFAQTFQHRKCFLILHTAPYLISKAILRERSERVFQSFTSVG